METSVVSSSDKKLSWIFFCEDSSCAPPTNAVSCIGHCCMCRCDWWVAKDCREAGISSNSILVFNSLRRSVSHSPIGSCEQREAKCIVPSFGLLRGACANQTSHLVVHYYLSNLFRIGWLTWLGVCSGLHQDRRELK